MAANAARLASDEKRLADLVDASDGLVAVTRRVGQPPNRYVMALRCRGVDHVTDGRAVFREEHIVEVLLGPEYPFREPRVEFKTPVLHPHIWPDNHVCLGDWKPAEFLDLLVKRLFKVVQYFPEYLDPDSVANYDAQDWVDVNPEVLPLGSVVPGEANRGPATPPRPTFIYTAE